MKYFKFLILMLVLVTFASCNKNDDNLKVIFAADMQHPMGWNNLKIYSDMTFGYAEKRLLKTINYKGSVKISKDKLIFMYDDEAPSIGTTAVIDDIFLTYSEGIVNEVLEIKINKLQDK